MVRRCALALILVCVGGSVCAQSWPSKPIRAIVPYTAGGAIDIVSRTVAQQLSVQLGQPIVIESRPGAGGVIGTAAVAKADPDGHTILLTASSHTISPWAYSNLAYDTVGDLAGITPLANLPNVLVVAPSANIRSAQALVAAARAKSGGLNYASGGSGSATHLNAERFRLSAGFAGVHIPFKGGPEALTEVMTGRVDFVFSPILPSLPFIREGKAIALGVSTSKRASALPDVPTTLEAGFANSNYNFWVGMFVPAKTPRDIVDKLHQETVKVLQSPEIQAKLAGFGADTMLMKPTEFDVYVKNEIATNEALVKAAGLAAK
jgi:tripartite-type tricarboxylate transporter receptor subunit TctC